MLAIIVIIIGLVFCLFGVIMFVESAGEGDVEGFFGILIAFVVFGIGIAFVVGSISGWNEAADTKANYDTYVEYVETTKIQLESEEAALRAECIEWLKQNKDMNVDDSVSFDTMLLNVPELKVLLGQRLTDYKETLSEYNRINQKVNNVSFDKVFYWPW